MAGSSRRYRPRRPPRARNRRRGPSEKIARFRPSAACVDRVRSPAAQTAASLAPEAFAHAEKIRRQADEAYQQGDLSGAQVLAEHAVAAYQHALVLARIGYAT